MALVNISKKRKFVADGVFYSELNEVSLISITLFGANAGCFQLFSRQLAADGYAGLEVRVTAVRTEIIIKATRTQDVLGEKGQRIRELTSVVQKR
jgi:small subunit ribosomal protein S3e